MVIAIYCSLFIENEKNITFASQCAVPYLLYTMNHLPFTTCRVGWPMLCRVWTWNLTLLPNKKRTDANRRQQLFSGLGQIHKDLSCPRTTKITLDGLLRGKITIILKTKKFQNPFDTYFMITYRRMQLYPLSTVCKLST